MQKVQAEMSTQVALDTLKAETSLKSLNAVISSTKAAWKSQEVALKSTGEYLKAAEVRYKGLGDSIKAQEAKIESLREKQKGLDVTTKAGAESYLKYQKDIDAATTQLKSLESQQSRAKSSLEYQKSGLAGLQTEYKQITTVSNAYVERLKAEGKQQEANKAQMVGYKDSISNLNKQLSAQEKELERVATASGKDSDAWLTQKVRVDETATALAKAKTSMTELDSAMKKANPSVFTRIKTAIECTNKQAKKTPSLFKKIVAGGLVTNAISNGFSTLTSSIKSTITSGLELDEAGEKINDTWKNMGKNANDIQILGDQMSYLRAQTGASGTEINTMQKSVDSFTHGVTEKTTVISAGIAGIATASHIGGSGMDTLAKSMQKVVASGDLTSGGLARLEKQAPTLGAQLAKAAGVSQGAFATMVAKGKISSADFQNLLYKIGTTSGDTFKTYGKTAEGAMAQIKGGWTSLKAKMAKPLLEVKNSGMESLSSLITSPVVQNAATSLGKGMAYVANMAKKGLDYISAHKKDVTGIASDMWDIAKIAGAEVWSIAKTTIKDIAGWLGVGGKNAKTMKDPLGTVHDILDKIVKNKSGIQTTVKVLAGLWATKKVLEFAGAVGTVYDKLKKLGESGLGSKVASTLTTSMKSAGGFSNLSTGSKVATVAAGAGVVASAGVDIAKAFTDKSSTAKYKDAGKGIGTAIGGGIGLYFGGPLGAALGASIGKVVGGYGGKAAQTFVKGWNAKKRPTNSWLAGIGFDANKSLLPVIKGFASLWKSISSSPLFKMLGKLFTATFKNVLTIAKAYFKYISAVFKAGFNIFKSVFKLGLDLIDGNWKNVWKDIKNVVKSVWDGIKSVVVAGIGLIKSVIHAGLSAISGVFKAVWGGIKSVVGNVVNWVASHIKSVWGGLSGFVSGIFNGIKNAILHPIQTAKSLLGGLVRGIKGLFNFHISLPHIPLPHFDISGSMNPIYWIKHHKLPHISVDWYANGGIINTPTLLSAGNRLAIGGEAGPEMVVPLSASKASRAWQLLGQAVQQINANQASAQIQVAPASDNSDLIAAINALGVLMTKLSFNVQIGDDQFYPKVAPKVKAYNDRQNSFRTAWQD
jgi:tape measure domain-containing protein